MDTELVVKYLMVEILAVFPLNYMWNRFTTPANITNDRYGKDYEYLQMLVKRGLLEDNFSINDVKWIPGFKYHKLNQACKKASELNEKFKPDYKRIKFLLNMRLVVIIITTIISALMLSYLEATEYFYYKSFLEEVIGMVVFFSLPLIGLWGIHKVIDKKVFAMQNAFAQLYF